MSKGSDLCLTHMDLAQSKLTFEMNYDNALISKNVKSLKIFISKKRIFHQFERLDECE
jgi:hypothetical protein